MKKFLKIALMTGVIALAISLCSCSASKPADQHISPDTTHISTSSPVASADSDIRSVDSVASVCKAADSVSRKSLRELLADSQIELTDLSLTYSTGHTRRHNTQDSSAFYDTQPDRSRLTPPDPSRTFHRATLKIGKLSASNSTAQKCVSASDSAVLSSAAVSAVSQKENTTDVVYQDKSRNAVARLILAFAAIFGILIGYLYYRQRKITSGIS